ncbi:uncharacterized, partial [Tachysurus ichikawai]
DSMTSSERDTFSLRAKHLKTLVYIGAKVTMAAEEILLLP